MGFVAGGNASQADEAVVKGDVQSARPQAALPIAAVIEFRTPSSSFEQLWSRQGGDY
jgi:hypothetical protein